jgi:hypothetical protein
MASTLEHGFFIASCDEVKNIILSLHGEIFFREASSLRRVFDGGSRMGKKLTFGRTGSCLHYTDYA